MFSLAFFFIFSFSVTSTLISAWVDIRVFFSIETSFLFLVLYWSYFSTNCFNSLFLTNNLSQISLLATLYSSILSFCTSIISFWLLISSLKWLNSSCKLAIIILRFSDSASTRSSSFLQSFKLFVRSSFSYSNSLSFELTWIGLIK